MKRYAKVRGKRRRWTSKSVAENSTSLINTFYPISIFNRHNRLRRQIITIQFDQWEWRSSFSLFSIFDFSNTLLFSFRCVVIYLRICNILFSIHSSDAVSPSLPRWSHCQCFTSCRSLHVCERGSENRSHLQSNYILLSADCHRTTERLDILPPPHPPPSISLIFHSRGAVQWQLFIPGANGCLWWKGISNTACPI